MHFGIIVELVQVLHPLSMNCGHINSRLR